MAIPDVTAELLGKIAEHDFAAVAAVADVTDEWDGARVAADGRASLLPEYNRAAVIRAAPDSADALLDKTARFFGKRNRPAAVTLDPLSSPGDLPDRLAARGFAPADPPDELLLWDPEAPHLYTAPEVYMTLATNATLDAWLDIAAQGLEPAAAEQARAMGTLAFRTAGFSFWFALFGGTPAGACPLWVRDGLARVGSLHVKEEFRGRGVGLALLNFVTRQSRKDGGEVTYAWRPAGGRGAGLCRTAGYSVAHPEGRATWVRKDQG